MHSLNQKVKHPLLRKHQVELFVKREDLLHPVISGNKFRKLKYNIKKAQAQEQTCLLTFGGAFSNHIAATASAGSAYGFHTVGVIRGEELGQQLETTLAQNETLQHAHQQGMQLHFVSREAYRHKESSVFHAQLKKRFGDFYLVPEGGTNTLAIKGCQEILTANDLIFDFICCSVGTGGTLAGLITSAAAHQKVIGFPALKATHLQQQIETLINAQTNWMLKKEYHFGGYAKCDNDLVNFINSFYETQQILLDPVYTGKLLFGIFKEIEAGKFPKKSRILAIHTGGLQGIAGMNRRLKNKKATLIKTAHED